MAFSQNESAGGCTCCAKKSVKITASGKSALAFPPGLLQNQYYEVFDLKEDELYEETMGGGALRLMARFFMW